MTRTFADKDVEALFNGGRVRRFVNIETVARRKLVQLHAAATLDFLRVPPGNRLEALKGDRAGQHSNTHQRPVPRVLPLAGGRALDVEIVDYH